MFCKERRPRIRTSQFGLSLLPRLSGNLLILLALAIFAYAACASSPEETISTIESKYAVRFHRRRITEERIQRFQSMLEEIETSERPFSRMIDGVEYGVMVANNRVSFRYRTQDRLFHNVDGPDTFEIVPLFLYTADLASIQLDPGRALPDSFSVIPEDKQATVELPDGLYWYFMGDPHNPYRWYEGFGENPIFIVGDLSDAEFQGELALYMAGTQQDFWIRDRN